MLPETLPLTDRVDARRLYHSLGFAETDEWEDDEIIARLMVTP